MASRYMVLGCIRVRWPTSRAAYRTTLCATRGRNRDSTEVEPCVRRRVERRSRGHGDRWFCVAVLRLDTSECNADLAQGYSIWANLWTCQWVTPRADHRDSAATCGANRWSIRRIVWHATYLAVGSVNRPAK